MVESDLLQPLNCGVDEGSVLVPNGRVSEFIGKAAILTYQ
jgi:hypothetical protein